MASDTLKIGSYRQLFVDDHVVESMKGLTRTMHTVEKRPEPVMVPEHPWEHKTHYIWDGGTVLYDDDEKLFKLWHGVAQTRLGRGGNTRQRWTADRGIPDGGL